jgi:hypothetical protein
MPDNDALYNVCERRRNPAHASVDDVVELILERAQHPWTEHRNTRRLSICGCHASKAQISYLVIPSSTQATMNNTNRTIITMPPMMRSKDGS